MKSALAAITAVAAGLFAANMLGVAVAEAPTTGTPVRTIAVEGVATLPVGRYDSATAATAVYREATAAAVSDGQGKAAFLAGKAGATLGVVQTIAEGGGDITCSGGEETGYDEYEGEQPDFGTAAQSVTPTPVAASTPAKSVARVAPGAKRKSTKRKHAKAKKAAAVTCTLSAQVSLTYTLS